MKSCYCTLLYVDVFSKLQVLYDIIFYLQEFIDKLFTQQFQALHPWSSYQRRNFALSILQLLATIFPPSSISLTNSPISPLFNFYKAMKKNQARCLIHALQDSYDANRVITLQLLNDPQCPTGLEVRQKEPFKISASDTRTNLPT